MVHAKYYIGDESIEYSFDENVSINNAVDQLCMMYYEKMQVMPLAIFLSPDLYKLMMVQNVRFHTQLPVAGFTAASFHTSLGTVMVQLVNEPKERFIYAGNRQGYEQALIDKRFEEIFLED